MSNIGKSFDDKLEDKLSEYYKNRNNEYYFDLCSLGLKTGLNYLRLAPNYLYLCKDEIKYSVYSGITGDMVNSHLPYLSSVDNSDFITENEKDTIQTSMRTIFMRHLEGAPSILGSLAGDEVFTRDLLRCTMIEVSLEHFNEVWLYKSDSEVRGMMSRGNTQLWDNICVWVNFNSLFNGNGDIMLRNQLRLKEQKFFEGKGNCRIENITAFTKKDPNGIVIPEDKTNGVVASEGAAVDSITYNYNKIFSIISESIMKVIREYKSKNIWVDKLIIYPFHYESSGGLGYCTYQSYVSGLWNRLAYILTLKY